MNYLPKRRRPARMGLREPSKIICSGHIQWVRGHECLLAGKNDPKHPCVGKVQAHHSTTRGAGGGDETVVPLCVGHHAQLESPGWSQRRMEQVYGLNMQAVADALWESSPHGKKYRANRQAEE